MGKDPSFITAVEADLPVEFGKADKNNDKNAEKKRDGTWVMLQAWSSCTLACGGGTMTMQRMCIPPVSGGKPCVGPSTQIRPCNMQSCPPMSPELPLPDKTLPTKIKIRPISNRLQRFEICIVKEGDMEMVMEELTQFPRTPKIPIHVILNNRTISGFASDNYDAILWSFELAKMRPMENFKEDPDLCFILSDGTAGRHAIVC